MFVNVINPASHAPPFGVVDTPANNASGLVGGVGITGWALDELGVNKVDIWRDPVAGEPSGLVYIGDAVFVDGARPDVQAVYPSYPLTSRAGWGLQILTNELPNTNGTRELAMVCIGCTRLRTIPQASLPSWARPQ